jgi:acetyl-CoA synthetase
VEVRDAEGRPTEPGEAGYLAVTGPWPGMPRGLTRAATAEDWAHVTGDHAVVVSGERRADGDGARADQGEYVRFLGRDDDTVTVGDTAYGPASIEAAIIGVDGVAEAAVVESEHAAHGAVAFVCTDRGRTGDDELGRRIERETTRRLGPAARLESVVFAPELPKTHSGKIMRRLLSAIADGEEYGDTSALRNPETVGEIESLDTE